MANLNKQNELNDKLVELFELRNNGVDIGLEPNRFAVQRFQEFVTDNVVEEVINSLQEQIDLIKTMNQVNINQDTGDNN